MADFSQEVTRIRKALGFNQTEFANTLDVTQSTVSRWESGADIRFEHLERINKLATKRGLPTITRDLQYINLRAVPVVGEVRAGFFQEAVELPQEEWSYIEVGEDRRFPRVQRFGLTVVGPSMNQVYPEGTLLVCARITDIGREPKSGERVIVHRTNHDGLVEASCKEFVVNGDGRAWLWPRSNDPHHQQPIRLDQQDGGTESVEIHALVIGSYRPE